LSGTWVVPKGRLVDRASLLVLLLVNAQASGGHSDYSEMTFQVHANELCGVYADTGRMSGKTCIGSVKFLVVKKR
jgi:hypothetical protein